MVRWQRSALPLLGAAIVVLYLFDPSKGGFPACPFHALTGYLCPGCGSQRAVHDLLHGNVGKAFRHNALLVVSIPLLAMHGAWGRLFKATRPLSSHNGVVLAWAMLIIGWGILRNV
jgi:hypothetical protein